MRQGAAIAIPDKPEEPHTDPTDLLLAILAGSDTDERDVTKPVCKDANGNLHYAPRGIRITWP